MTPTHAKPKPAEIESPDPEVVLSDDRAVTIREPQPADYGRLIGAQMAVGKIHAGVALAEADENNVRSGICLLSVVPVDADRQGRPPHRRRHAGAVAGRLDEALPRLPEDDERRGDATGRPRPFSASEKLAEQYQLLGFASGQSSTLPDWAGELMIRRLLWQQYGVPADLTFWDVGRALSLHAAEVERAKNSGS